MLSALRIFLALSCLLWFGLVKHLWHSQFRTQHQKACAQVTGIDDVLVVLKTGATELYEKLPVHLATTFACFSDYLVYSDLEQEVGSVHVHDAVSMVSEDLRKLHDDMEQYAVLQRHVKLGADAADLKGKKSWGLDKYKFLPMISDARRRFSGKKWLVFIEADTYVSAHNLVLWLAQLNAKHAIYAGAQVMIGDTEFAHGGSGIVLSSGAAKGLSDAYERGQQHWERKLAKECCGDKVVAEVLLEASTPVRLYKSFPLMQGETPTSLDWSNTHWCRPAVTWHHVDPAGIGKLWQFEQRWRHTNGEDKPIRFADYFDAFILPRIMAANGTMGGWDNLSSDWVFERGKIVSPAFDNATACEAYCMSQQSCLQWAWSPGVCRAGKTVRLGWRLDRRPELGSAGDRIAQAGVFGTEVAMAGWLLERIWAFKTFAEPCHDGQLWSTHED